MLLPSFLPCPSSSSFRGWSGTSARKCEEVPRRRPPVLTTTPRESSPKKITTCLRTRRRLMLLQLFDFALAEVYRYRLSLPEPRSLELSHSLTLSATPDYPGEILFDGEQTRLHSVAGSEGAGLHVVVVKAEDVARVEEHDQFCCTEQDIEKSAYGCAEKTSLRFAKGPNAFLPSSGVPEVVGKALRFPVVGKGMYYVGIANCGETRFDQKRDFLQGAVYARSSHGYLPAVDAGAMFFNEYLAGFYAIVLAYWLFLVYSFKSHLVVLHYLLTAVLVFAFANCLIRYMLYSIANSAEEGFLPSAGEGDEDPSSATFLPDLAQVVRFAGAMLVCAAICFGAGIVDDHTAFSEKKLLLALCGLAYTACSAGRTLILREHSFGAMLVPTSVGFLDHLRDSASVLLVLPEALAFAFLANWGSSSYTELKRQLTQSKQQEAYTRLVSFGHLIYYCGISVIASTFLQMAFEWLFDASGRWSSLWFFDEGAPNLIFAALVVGLLVLFAPVENFRLRLSSSQVAVAGGVGEGDHDLEATVMGAGAVGGLDGGTTEIELAEPVSGSSGDGADGEDVGGGGTSPGGAAENQTITSRYLE